MRTNDTTFRTNYAQNNSFHSFNNHNDVMIFEHENYDSMSREGVDTDNFDNYDLCQKFGQPNIEKTILLLVLIILFSGFILYYYWNLFKLYYIKLLLISSSIDLLLLLFYCSLRIKFNVNEWINSFPVQFYYFLDYIIIINCILKLYLLVSSVKLMIFCPGYKSFALCFEAGVGGIKNLLNCCEGQADREYNRVSDDSSDFNDSDNVFN